jgi:riboflavin biosynthesis pyrimidine reductase
LDVLVERLWPGAAGPAGVVDDTELAERYAFPAELDRPWVKLNFVTSADGAVSVGGKSGGLSSPDDQRVFRLGRSQADVVLVGAATALTERYRGIKPAELDQDLRSALGLPPVPPIAVVSGRLSLEPNSLLLADTRVPPLVFTCAAAPADRRAAVADAGADVVLAGDTSVELPLVLAELDRRGLRRVVCEGGPRLFGSLIVADRVDELCLSVAPVLAGGDAGRIAAGPLPEAPVRLKLASALHAGDMLLLRYLRN